MPRIQYHDHERVTAVVVGVFFSLHPRQHKFVFYMYLTLKNKCETQYLT